MAKHVWRIKEEYFLQLKTGEKKLEVRVGYPQIKKVRQGDTITFENYGENEFNVKRVATYGSFEQMLNAEGTEGVIPGVSYRGVLRTLQTIYPPNKESLGIYVFELSFVERGDLRREFFIASDLLKANENKKFAKIIVESYILTDWICRDYPEHCDHFYSKFVPSVFNGEREFIACYINKKIVAIAILKKSEHERKISTFYVKPDYQKQGIATELMEKCFKWLGTTKPLVTIADYKLEQFKGIIKKFDWHETQILEAGYYNDHSREHVFNGKI